MLLWRVNFERRSIDFNSEVMADDPLRMSSSARLVRVERSSSQQSLREAKPILDRPTQEGRLRRKPDERALQLSNVASHALGDEETHLDEQVDVLELSLFPNDGDARLELGGLDVRHEAPLESATPPGALQSCRAAEDICRS